MDFITIFTIVLLIVAIVLFFVVLSIRGRYLKTQVSEILNDQVIFKVSVPQNNQKGPQSAEILYQALHGILKNDEKAFEHYSFEIAANHTGIYFVIVCNARYRQFVENQIYAQYPDAQVAIVQDYLASQQNQFEVFTELELARESSLPIKTFQNFSVDPLASITSALSKLNTGFGLNLQIIARPINNEWQKSGQGYIRALKTQTNDEGEKVSLEGAERQEIREIENKNNKLGFQCVIRVYAYGQDEQSTNQIHDDALASFKQFQAAQLNSFTIRKEQSTIVRKLAAVLIGKRRSEILTKKQQYAARFINEYETTILNTEELASVFHLPTNSVQTPNLAWVSSKKLEIPQNLPLNQGRIYGLTDYRGIHHPFGVKQEDRRRHMYILGKTGSGKSVLMKNMVAGDILDGHGFAFIDPHGDAVEEILNMIPVHRKDDVVYLDPSDVNFPIAFNMLDAKEGESVDLLADGIVTVFKKYFGNSWGPRLQYILTNTIQTLLYCQNVSLLAVQRMLTDQNYRKFLLKQVDDPFIRKFWEEEYAEMAKNPRLITETISPIQNKVGRFLSSTMIRNMIGQVTSSIDLQEIMDNRKILLVNLSQGKIGEENSSLLGGMIITRLYSNAMQRANIPETQRKDFYLYVDEFQNFATETFVKILSEARKYGLNLIVAHQYIDQLIPSIQDAIFGNVGTLLNFVVSPKDAARLEKEFSPHLSAEDLVNLERFRFSSKMTIDGSQSVPFTGISLAPNYTNYNLKDEIVSLSREKYAKPKDSIESKLNKWASQEYNDKGNLEQRSGNSS